MTRRDFVSLISTVTLMGCSSKPSINSTVVVTIVKVHRYQDSEGKWTESWSSIPHPTKEERIMAIRNQNGYKLIERKTEQLIKGAIN